MQAAYQQETGREQVREKMAEKSEEYVSQLIQLFDKVNEFHGRMVSDEIGCLHPRDIWWYCAVCAESYYRYVSLSISKPSIPSTVLDRVVLASINPFYRAKTDLYLEKVVSCGDIVFPEGFNDTFDFAKNQLDIWGHVLDVCGGTVSGDAETLVFGDELRQFCASMLDEKGDIKEWDGHETARQSHMTADFLRRSCFMLGQMRTNVLNRLSEVDVNEHPNARLTTIAYRLRAFGNTFMRDAKAIGPYSPVACSPGSYHQDILHECCDVESEIGSEPGILQTEQVGDSIQFNFRSKSGNTVKWEITEWTGSIASKDDLIGQYAGVLFGTWSYTTGEFLGYLDYETEQRAHWYVSDDSQIIKAADETEDEAYPLIANKDYELLANRAIEIVRNNQPAWNEGRVQWSYIRDLDEVVRAFEHARRVYEVKHGISNPSASVRKREGRPTDDIPAEYKSPPMSLKEMAGYFGNNVKWAKIKTMIRSGSIKAEEITRESYYFDLRTVPAYVKGKIEKRIS